jgi:hypothetical protein
MTRFDSRNRGFSRWAGRLTLLSTIPRHLGHGRTELPASLRIVRFVMTSLCLYSHNGIWEYNHVLPLLQFSCHMDDIPDVQGVSGNEQVVCSEDWNMDACAGLTKPER